MSEIPPVVGTVYSDILYGTNNITFGFEEIFALAGDDTVYGNGGKDNILGGFGNDDLHGGDERDFLNGDKMELFGGHMGNGNDYLNGDNGSDVLTGEAGSDRMWGGADGDIFLYWDVSDSPVGGIDYIYDFVSGSDKIDLSRIDADLTIAGNQAFGANQGTYVGGILTADVIGGADLQFLLVGAPAINVPVDFIL